MFSYYHFFSNCYVLLFHFKRKWFSVDKGEDTKGATPTIEPRRCDPLGSLVGHVCPSSSRPVYRDSGRVDRCLAGERLRLEPTQRV